MMNYHGVFQIFVQRVPGKCAEVRFHICANRFSQTVLKVYEKSVHHVLKRGRVGFAIINSVSLCAAGDRSL